MFCKWAGEYWRQSIPNQRDSFVLIVQQGLSLFALSLGQKEELFIPDQ